MISLCITGLSDSAIAAVDRALQAAGVAPAQVAQRDADLSFASWHARVYQAADQGQHEPLEGAGPMGEAPTLGRLWEQLASDLFLSNIQQPVWGWADAKSLGLLDYWLAFDASIHFVLVATSPEQMLAEHLSNLALEDAAATKSHAAMPVDRLLARWSQAHHAMLRFALRHPARCMLVLADDLEQPVLVEAAKTTWPKALKALRMPQKDAKGGLPKAAPSSSDGVLRHFAEQWCEAYPQAKTLHHEIASVAAATNTKNSEKQASEAVLQGVLATVAMARKVPSLLAQVDEAERLRDAQLRDAAELKMQLGQEVLAKTQLQSQLQEQAAANSALLQEKAVLTQESQIRAQEAQASKSALEAEVLANTKAMASLNDEKSQRKSADDERALLLTQLHQVQEDLESYYLKSKELEKENKSLGDAKRDLEAKTKADAAAAAASAKERAALSQEKSALLEGKAKLMESNDAQAKAKAELKEKLEEERKARAVLVSENAKLAQEKAKLIEARDSLAKARAEVQEKLSEASKSRAEVVQEKIALSQKNKELIAAREAEIKRTTELKARLEDELKAKSVLASENAKLSQERAKLIESRAEVQEKLSEAGKSRAEVVQEKIALSQKNKELIAAREVEVKAKAQTLALLEKETQLRADLEARLQAESQAHSNLKQEKAALAHENATLGQEKTKVIAARDAESKAKAAALDDLAKAQARSKMAEEESALMLAQLHKLQEDAERYDLRLKDMQAKSEQEKSKLIEVRDAQSKARAETQEKLNEAGKARAEIVQEKMALSQEKKEAIAARDAEAKAKAQALAQLEKETKLRADLEAKLQAEIQTRTTLKQEKTALAQENATLGQEKTKVIAARDAESKAKAAALDDLAKAKARTKMAEEESALMLAQLHKLQEDAERYDLRIKDLQANLNQATARFRRVTSRQPDGIDWESVQTQPLLVGGRPALQCRATNVAVMGKEWKSLEFVAFIQEGTLAFTFLPNPDAAGVGPLTRLPRGVGSVAQFTARAGKEAQGQPGMELLKDLSTSDWDLLRGLPRLLSLGLQYVRGAWPEGMPGPTAWESAAKATLPALLRVPVALRFDVLKLQSASALPTYEHLRLRLDPLSLGKKRLAGFEFRFGCNLGQGNQFGGNARLEFFRGSGTPTFDRWVPNARDGAEERLDLVFVFPTSMNLKDWSALSVSDRSLVLLLADQLPTMLAELGPSSVQLARPMAEWIALAEKLRTFVRARLDVTGVQKQPDALVDAVPGSVPLDALSAPARRRASSAQAAVSDIKKQRVAAKTPVAAKKAALPAASARSAVRTEPARARKR